MPDAQTFFVFAKIWDPIQPIARGERYEDPLLEALEPEGLGEVTGGGSQLGADNEIQWVGVDIELVNLDSALELTRSVLEHCGAPRGSRLEFSRGAERTFLPFGTSECVAVYLDGVGLPDSVYEGTDIDVLADRLEEALSGGVGEIRGSWAGATETSIYMFGPDAEALYGRIAPVLHSYPLCQNARVVIRRGPPELSPRTIRIPMLTVEGGGV